MFVLYPSITSMCSQSAPSERIHSQSLFKLQKSAERMEGAIRTIVTSRCNCGRHPWIFKLKMEMTDSPTKSPKSPNFDRSPRDRADLPSAVAVEGDAVTSGASASGAGGSLFVGKLAFDCRTRELEDLFGKYGRITRCDIKRGRILNCF